MTMALVKQKMTLEEFLAWEDLQPERHEFYSGEVFAMVGGRRIHERVIGNLSRRLGNHLEGSACQVFAAGMKLELSDNMVLYPDVMVTCDRADLHADRAMRSPTLVIEVLSPSTQAYDRSQKFALYRQLASLKEYILIDPETLRVEGFRREPDDRWLLVDMSQDTALDCASVACAVPMAQVFEGVIPAE
jgi:Uma2 family endonuclease